MWDFSTEEGWFLLAAAVVGVAGAVKWYAPLIRVSALGTRRRPRFALAVVPLVCLALLYVVLQNWADPVSVVGHVDYIVLFLIGGAAWVFGAAWLFPVFGLSVRHDVIERHNPAATVAACGAIVGVMLAYAQSNIGNGPTIWTTLVPALVATAGVFIAWVIAEMLGGGVAEAIAVDRDVAAGLRLAALLTACGAILGRAMAGDWTDWRSTFVDFARLGWPAVVLAVAAGLLHRAWRPTPRRPQPALAPLGIIPAVLIMAVAAAYLVYLGKPYVAPTQREAPAS